MKACFFLALIALLCISCTAQTPVTTDTNRNGSLTLFENNKESNTIYVTRSGNMGIGQKNPKDRLEVNGQIHARSVKIDLKEWADYVFEDTYDLVRLREIENYINTHGHLPNIPSAAEVKENGIELGEMNRLLLEKVEELTLHLIAQEKEIESLKKQMLEIQQKSTSDKS